MNLSAEELILVTEKLAEICELVPECGIVIPAPVVFVDKSDFQNNAGDHTLDTQKEIETSEAACLVITFSKPPAKPNREGGFWTYYFNFYLFRERSGERLDETENPDEFRKRCLRSYFDFVNAILGLQTQIENELPIDIDSDNIADCSVSLEAGNDFIDEFDKCRYIGGVNGYSVDLPAEVKIKFKICC